MRNDANDDFDDVPSLRATHLDDDEVPSSTQARERTSVQARPVPAAKVKNVSTGPLWALVGALLFAFAGLAWWSFQQISLMEQQLVATQESFARISEEAAGRLQVISGKVVASEANVNTGSEALKLQIRDLESKLLEQGKQQQGVAGQQTDLDQRLAQMTASTTEQQTTSVQLQGQIKALTDTVGALKAAQTETDKLDAQLKALAGDVATLKKQSATVQRLEQDLLVLKSEQDNRPAVPQGANTAEFDAFRGLTTRNISTLQSQIQNLQKQLDEPARLRPLGQ